MSDSTLNNQSNPDSTENKDLQNPSQSNDGKIDPKTDEKKDPDTDEKNNAENDKKSSSAKSNVAKEGTGAVAKQKDVKIACPYAQIRIGKEYFSPDHDGNITVPAHLADEAKKVCGV